jgi:LuxR family maltose regulon positive regulatory protein
VEGSTTLHSQLSILEYLDRANLFIIPLDNRRLWYRYHHLFADLLSSRLQSINPNLVSTLHCRASDWYEGEGMIADAVDHALLAEDYDRALRLIEHAALTSIWTSGDLPVLLNWSRRMPEDVLMARPRLCLYYARALFFAGQVSAAEDFLRGAENALQARGGGDEADDLWGVLFTNKATFRAMCGESQAALELASQALEHIRAEDVSNRARIAHAVGMAEFLRGDMRRAEPAFSEAVQLSRVAGNRNLGLDVLSCLSLTLVQAGQLRRAARLCEDALATDPESRRAPAASTVHLALAQVLYERNELYQALKTLDFCIELGRKAAWPHLLWQAYALQAQVRVALSDHGGAQDALGHAEQVAKRYNVPRVTRMVSACRARAALYSGDMDTASRWAEDYQRQMPVDQQHDFEELTLARLLLSQGRTSEALVRLEALQASADTGGRGRTVIEALDLQALALGYSEDPDASQEKIRRALELAEPEGYVTAFLDKGENIAELLKISGSKRKAGPQPVVTRGVEPGVRPAKNTLVEPLSERELEVLRLIAEGLSNQEVAHRLYLSVNTLKAHTTNIYQKLDVHNRVQAVTRARELRLLPDE